MFMPVYRWEVLDIVNQVRVSCPHHCGCALLMPCPAPLYCAGAPILVTVSVTANGSSLCLSLDNCSWPVEATLPRNTWESVFLLRGFCSLCPSDMGIQKLKPLASQGTTLVPFTLQNSPWGQAEVRLLLETSSVFSLFPCSVLLPLPHH